MTRPMLTPLAEAVRRARVGGDGRDGARMTRRSDIVDIAGELRRETDKAFLVFDGAREVWLPKSQVEHDPDDGTFAMPEWLAKEKGLI